MEVDEREIEDVARKRLESAIAEVAGLSPAMRIEQAVADPYPAWVLCHLAAGAGLLVVGSVGHGPLAGPALGSVSTRCGQFSSCPVVIVSKGGQAPPGAESQ